MDSILSEIFDGEYDFTPKQDKEQQKLDQKVFKELDKVQRMLGEGFVDHFMELESEQENRRNFRYYQAGFRLGVRLMLEALGG